MSNDKQELIDYVTNEVRHINTQYPNLITEEELKIILDKLIISDLSLEVAKEEFRNYIEGQISINEVSLGDNIDTGLQTNNHGIYLSGLMSKALLLIDCKNVEDIKHWVSIIPNVYNIPAVDYNMPVEDIKKYLFDVYKESLVSTSTIRMINGNKDEKIISQSFLLAKKLSGLNLSTEEIMNFANIGITQGLSSMYHEIKKYCLYNYGREKGNEIFNKIVTYYPSDYENFTSTSYEQMEALYNEILNDSKACTNSGGSYQIVVSSIGYGNNVIEQVNDNGSISYAYNVLPSVIGQEFAKRIGATYRLRSLINRNASNEMFVLGMDKESVLKVLKESLATSLESFIKNIGDNKEKKTFELFNELFDLDGKEVWSKFGITIDEIIEQVIIPNKGMIDLLKNNNVDFMYNETMLQISKDRRDKIKKMVNYLRDKGIINVFGDQDHTFSSDYRENNIEELISVANFLNELDIKIECSERDLMISFSELEKFHKMGKTKEYILKYKQALENLHSKIFAGVNYTRECEWCSLDNISGDFYQEYDQAKHGLDSYVGKYTQISNMVPNINVDKTASDFRSYLNWKEQVVNYFNSKETSTIKM